MKTAFSIRTIASILLTFFIAVNCYAQKKPQQKVDIITSLLSDTLNPEIYLIPIKIKFKGKDSVFITYNSLYELYGYFSSEFGWNRNQFVKQMRLLIFENKVFETSDDTFFSIKHCIPASECNCLYNESSDRLKKRVIDKTFYGYPDNRFACFVYKCLKNKVILASTEGYIIYHKGDEW